MKNQITKILSIFLLGLVIINTACTSEKEGQTSNDDEKPICNKKQAEQGITYAITECIRADIYEKDIELNTIYKELKSKLSKEEGEKLRQSQLNWVKFKDSEQEFLYFTFDGTLIQIEGLSNYLNILERRIEDLKSHLSKTEVTRLTD